jgi:arylsulfatase A-like enzyme
MTKTHSSANPGLVRAMFTGARIGAGTWIAFAAVECWFASIIPWLVLPRSSYAPVFPAATLVLIGSYAVIGGVVGALIALAARRGSMTEPDRSALLAAGCSFALVILFFLNALKSLSRGMLVLTEAVAAVCVILIISASRRRRPTMNGWGTALILLLPFRASQETFPDRSMLFKGGVAMAALLFAAAAAHLLASASAKMPKGARRTAAVLAVLFSVAVALAVGQFDSPLPPSDDSYHSRIARPNVLLVTMDTVRADHLPMYGYRRATTPNLASLSQTTTLFQRAIATSNESLATHASIMTGLYASKHGAHPFEVSGMNGGAPLDPTSDTLAERLAEAGYRTFAVVANHAYLAEDFGLAQGFDSYDCRPPSTIFRPNQPYLPRSAFESLINFALDLRVTMFRGAGQIDDLALRVLNQQRPGGRPLFLFVNYMDAHAPYEPPPPFDARFRGNDSATPAGVVPPELRRQADQYDGGIACVDQQIGRLISTLRRRGIYDDTLIIIMADHGESFGEKGFWGHGISVYEPQIHIPLIVKFPHQRTPSKVASAVSEADVFPTVIAAARLPPSQRLDGMALTAISERAVVSEAFKCAWDIHWIVRSSVPPAVLESQKSLSSERFKLIEGRRMSTLFDVLSDPAETRDQAETNRTTYGRLRDELADWRRANASRAGSAPLRDETVRRLRSLGYLQ